MEKCETINQCEYSMSDLKDILRRAFPHGDQKFIAIAVDQMLLYDRKNRAYAGKGDPLGNFKRVADILSLYWPEVFSGPQGPCIVAAVFSLKQLDCEMWNMCQNTEDSVEGFKGRTDDQAVYANLRACLRGSNEQKSS